MTYSIVARDPATGQLGVAVQTCMFGVGAIVPWTRPGVGAVATQAINEPAYGPRVLDAIETGRNADEALTDAIERDESPELRQVGVVDADGGTAAMTGDLCVDHAGHLVREGYSVQANMMSSPDVWPAMAEAFKASAGSLAHRLLEALEAAERAGGDARGRMSAALVVVEGSEADRPGTGTVVDLRVDRSDDPLGELARLLDAAEAFGGFDHAVAQLLGGDAAGALRTIDDALARLPGEGNLRFLRAGALLLVGEREAGAEVLRALVAERPTWAVAARSFAAKGLVPLPEGVSIDAILG